MRVRRIAILIDGGFFIKRLPKLVDPRNCESPERVASYARWLCKRHVLRLTGLEGEAADGRWLDHVYRLFYYDAAPYEGISHHPLLNRRIDFGKSDVAVFRRQLFSALRRQRKFALRLGHLNQDHDWQIHAKHTKKLLKTRNWADLIERTLLEGGEAPRLDETQRRELRDLLALWRELGEHDVRFGLRQKGVDMRIGLDIASITLKRQADTIVLVTGDSDFVPAAKLARREGVEFLIDPLWQKIGEDLHEHVDGVASGLPRPGTASEPNTESAEN